MSRAARLNPPKIDNGRGLPGGGLGEEARSPGDLNALWVSALWAARISPPYRPSVFQISPSIGSSPRLIQARVFTPPRCAGFPKKPKRSGEISSGPLALFPLAWIKEQPQDIERGPARREPRSLEAAGTRGLRVSR